MGDEMRVACFEHSLLELCICFEFRISRFVFPPCFLLPSSIKRLTPNAWFLASALRAFLPYRIYTREMQKSDGRKINLSTSSDISGTSKARVTIFDKIEAFLAKPLLLAFRCEVGGDRCAQARRAGLPCFVTYGLCFRLVSPAAPCPENGLRFG